MKSNRNLEFLESYCLIRENNTIEGKDGNIFPELHGQLDQLFVRLKIWKWDGFVMSQFLVVIYADL